MVKIKEEQYEKAVIEHAAAQQNLMNNEVTKEYNGDSNTTVKLTRAKAKELNKNPLPILPLKVPEPPPEIAALINEDLCSDDEDEEYQPGDEDVVVSLPII